MRQDQLAHQLMFSMASPEHPALYFTLLGEPPLKMLRYQQQFDFFDPARINRSFRFVNLSAEAVAGDLDQISVRIAREVQAQGAAFVFVDSFRPVMQPARARDGGKLQRFLLELGTLLTSWQATTFLVGEYSIESDGNPLVSLADGLICLQQSVQRNSMVRKIEILKMRAQAILPGLHTFRISSSGITIFPPALQISETAAEASLGGPPVLRRTGLPPLDEMMGTDAIIVQPAGVTAGGLRR